MYRRMSLWVCPLLVLLIVSFAPTVGDTGVMELSEVPAGMIQPAPSFPAGAPPTGGTGFSYVVSTSLTDPLCAAPLAGADGVPDAYVNLAALGIPTQPLAPTDNAAFVVDFAGGEFDFFGADQGELTYFTDDGYVTFTPAFGPPYASIPTADAPNNLMAVFWRNLLFGSGVALANLTAGGVPVAAVIEFEDVQDGDFTPSNCCDLAGTGEPGCDNPACEAQICTPDGGLTGCCDFEWTGSCAGFANIPGFAPDCSCDVATYDVEWVGFYDADPTPGAYEYVFAYDNLSGDVTLGTIGLENFDASVGVPVFFDDITVTDGMAICFDLVQPPVAQCQDVAVSADENCQGDASVDDGSFDPDGFVDSIVQDPPGPYDLGDTLVTLTVTDNQGATDSCTATVTVVDDTAPTVTCTLDPGLLWPPNHRLVDVTADVMFADNCPGTTVALESLTSNEPDNGPGDGNTTDDAQVGVDDFHLLLRAERAGGGSGRIYTASYLATDGSDNATTGSCVAIVPHDNSGPLEAQQPANDSTVSLMLNDAGSEEVSADDATSAPERAREEPRPERKRQRGDSRRSRGTGRRGD